MSKPSKGRRGLSQNRGAHSNGKYSRSFGSDGSRGMQIPGKRAITEALESGVPAYRLVISDSIRDDGIMDAVVASVSSKGIDVEHIPPEEFKRRFSHIERADQGIVLEARPFEYIALPELVGTADEESAQTGRALIVVCDHITDSGNLGAIVRSADAVGASGIVIPNRRSAQVTSSTYKTSAGAVSHMPIAKVPNIRQAIEDLKEAGFWTVAASEHAEEVVWDIEFSGRIAIVMGNEHDGVSDLALKTCDDACRLPQMGAVSSLNVAQAATALMYEWLRQSIQTA